jgi:hypothetical protein
MSESVFKLSRVLGAPVSDEELIADLRHVAELLGTKKVTMDQYNLHGVHSDSTFHRRFGSWNKALILAGLTISQQINIPNTELFENILTLWQHYGRQPVRRELDSELSHFSQQPYNRRFGSWMNALQAFVNYANGTGAEIAEHEIETDVDSKHKTGRDPSLRLRWRVLQKDNFKCCGCGASPAITHGVELHVDHIHPWSKCG